MRAVALALALALAPALAADSASDPRRDRGGEAVLLASVELEARPGDAVAVVATPDGVQFMVGPLLDQLVFGRARCLMLEQGGFAHPRAGERAQIDILSDYNCDYWQYGWPIREIALATTSGGTLDVYDIPTRSFLEIRCHPGYLSTTWWGYGCEVKGSGVPFYEFTWWDSFVYNDFGTTYARIS